MTSPGTGLRVVTYNVRSLRDDQDAVVAVLRRLRPDLVLVQEAPRLLLSWLLCRRLAARSGLRIVTGGRRAYGNLLLRSDRVQVERAYDVRFPRRWGLHRRAAACAVLRVGTHRLAVAGSHLDLDPQARLDSARRVRHALARHAEAGVPLIVGADVNETAGEPAWQVLAAGLIDAGAALPPTFSTAAPSRRIDALLVDPRLTVARCERVEGDDVRRASDHFPVLADLRL